MLMCVGCLGGEANMAGTLQRRGSILDSDIYIFF